jgi:anti-anti-sigma regulatory factor
MGIHKTVRPTNRRTRASLPATFTLDHDETTGHRLRKLALDPRIDELLLDGRAVREVSARALGLLVAVRRLTEARGATTVLIDPSPELVGSIDRRWQPSPQCGRCRTRCRGCSSLSTEDAAHRVEPMNEGQPDAVLCATSGRTAP